MMVLLTNHVIAPAKSTLREPLAIWRFLRHIPAEYRLRPKKVLPSKQKAPGTLPDGKSGPDFCITFIKKLDKGLR